MVAGVTKSAADNPDLLNMFVKKLGIITINPIKKNCLKTVPIGARVKLIMGPDVFFSSIKKRTELKIKRNKHRIVGNVNFQIRDSIINNVPIDKDTTARIVPNQSTLVCSFSIFLGRAYNDRKKEITTIGILIKRYIAILNIG